MAPLIAGGVVQGETIQGRLLKREVLQSGLVITLYANSPPLKVLFPASAIIQKDVQVSGCQAGNTKYLPCSSLNYWLLHQSVDDNIEEKVNLHDITQ